ncbi:hypothetical protein HN587_03245 [Candidatus Woesearchaeota archaeon]|jgi:hypothetical protein|nr:hypothetical protein [Candidatus Woesearchaeota archaeon]
MAELIQQILADNTNTPDFIATKAHLALLGPERYQTMQQHFDQVLAYAYFRGKKRHENTREMQERFDELPRLAKKIHGGPEGLAQILYAITDDKSDPNSGASLAIRWLKDSGYITLADDETYHATKKGTSFMEQNHARLCLYGVDIARS